MFDRLQARLMSLGFRHVRRVVIFIVGMSLLLVGVVMIFTPGPAIVVIPASLALLGLEFEWARRLLKRARQMIQERANGLKSQPAPPVIDTATQSLAAPPAAPSAAREATSPDR